jgi:hypothetical protein
MFDPIDPRLTRSQRRRRRRKGGNAEFKTENAKRRMKTEDLSVLDFAFCILGFAFFIALFDTVAVGSGLNEADLLLLDSVLTARQNIVPLDMRFQLVQPREGVHEKR